MDTSSVKPGLFSFAQHPAPAGTGAWHKVASLLRQTGFVVLIGGGLSLLASLLLAWQYTTYSYAGGGMFGIVFGLAWMAAGMFWVSYTFVHWCNRNVAGWKHAQILAIVLIVLGGLGALSGLMAFGVYSILSAIAPMLGTWFMLSTVVSLITAAAYLYFGIMILTNRSKPECQAAFGMANAPPPGMAH